MHPPTHIATLEEVIDLVTCYGNKDITINLETKLSPVAPNETLSVDTYVNDIIPILQKKGYFGRTTIQSFDWRTLIRIHAKWPKIPIVALLDDTTVVPENGKYPWLGGVDLATFNGDWVAAAKSIGADVLSPVHGTPSNVTINTPGYKPFTTKDVVSRAHKVGMKVIPWTIDTEVMIAKLIDDGVDAIISNYPERVIWVAREKGLSIGKKKLSKKLECLSKA